MAVRIMTLDPGVTTGWAVYPDETQPNSSYPIKLGQHTGALLDLEMLLDRYQPDVVIFESFKYQRRDKVVLYPREVIGVIKLWCERRGIQPIEQTPSQAKNLWTDDKIKKLGLWMPSFKHAMDALRHLLYYLVVTKGDRSWLEPLRPETTTFQE
jgi:hypothetical protein